MRLLNNIEQNNVSAGVSIQDPGVFNGLLFGGLTACSSLIQSAYWKTAFAPKIINALHNFVIHGVEAYAFTKLYEKLEESKDNQNKC